MIYYFGITGPIGQGKSLFAEVLQRSLQKTNKVVQGSFAAPVKRIATEQFGWDGAKDDRGRHLLQMIGTDAGRHYNPDIWVDDWLRMYARNPGVVVIADDVRFENEARAIRDLSGKIIHIRRDDHPAKTTGHESEDGIARMPGDLFMSYPFPGKASMITDAKALVVACKRGTYDA